MKINLQNIEEIVFFDKKAQALFPEHRHLFDQWQIGQRVPGMKPLAQRSVLDFLNSLDKKNILKLEEYLNDTISVDKLDYRIVANHDCHVEDANQLCEFAEYREFCVSRTKDRLSISFWR